MRLGVLVVTMVLALWPVEAGAQRDLCFWRQMLLAHGPLLVEGTARQLGYAVRLSEAEAQRVLTAVVGYYLNRPDEFAQDEAWLQRLDQAVLTFAREGRIEAVDPLDAARAREVLAGCWGETRGGAEHPARASAGRWS